MNRNTTRTILVLAITPTSFTPIVAGQLTAGAGVRPRRPQGPCDTYTAAGAPCVAAHSTTRALYASCSGPLYQVLRQSDGKTLDIGVVQPVASAVPDPGGHADAAAQDAFCANTYCWISVIYDQSPKHNDLVRPPRGGFSGPAMGGFNNLPIADMAPVTIMGHEADGVFGAESERDVVGASLSPTAVCSSLSTTPHRWSMKQPAIGLTRRLPVLT